MRLGLLGAGRWGRTYLRTIAHTPEVRVTRVASRNPRTQELVPPGCKVNPDWREVVRGDDVDGIVIATPPALHAEMTLAALEHGRPVLVEKPLALSVESAQGILAAAAARGALVMVDHVHLFHPAYQQLKRAVAASGPIRGIHAEAGAPGPHRADVSVLWDWGPHDIAMCIDLLGSEPQEVAAERVERARVDAGWAERVRLSLRFAGNVDAHIELSTLGERRRNFEVRLDSGILRYDGALPERPTERPLARALHGFAAAIASGSTSTASVELGVAVVRTLARCDAALAVGGRESA